MFYSVLDRAPGFLSWKKPFWKMAMSMTWLSHLFKKTKHKWPLMQCVCACVPACMCTLRLESKFEVCSSQNSTEIQIPTNQHALLFAKDTDLSSSDHFVRLIENRVPTINSRLQPLKQSAWLIKVERPSGAQCTVCYSVLRHSIQSQGWD